MTDPFAAYCQEPSRERLARFVVAYTDRVTRLVQRVVRCPDAAQDVVQEVFVRLSRSRLRIEDVPSPKAYVLRAALNMAREHLRRGKARAYHETEAARARPSVNPSVEDEAIAREQVGRLYSAIDSLPEPLRLAMHLRAIEDLSYREIASVTGSSASTTGMRIQRARRELRRRLGDGQLSVAWTSLEMARQRGWFPAGTELSPEAIAGLEKAARRTGKATGKAPHVYAGVALLASLSLLGVSTTWMFDPPLAGLPEERDQTTVPATRRDLRIERAAPPVAATSKPENPMAPVVAGAETEPSEVEGAAPAERVGMPPVHEREGGEIMTGKRTLLASTVLAIGVAAAVGGAETGDFDGDGRLTIADVLHLEDRLELVEGSLAAFESFPCYLEESTAEPDRTLWLQNMVPTSVYLESLRRGVEGSLPHWDSVWPEDVTSEPLLEDARVEIELLPSTAPGGANDRARLDFKLVVRAPVRSFSIVLEAPPGLLEAPPGGFRGFGPWFDTTLWRRKYEVLGANRQMHRFGDLEVAVTTQAYLITGGRYVVTYDLLDNSVWDDIQPGEYLVTIEPRMSLGTSAGTYPIEVLPASEVLFRDGTVRRPVVTAESELTVERDVTEGLDDGIPPLLLDRESRSALGDIEFRVVDEDGHPPEPGEPVVEALNDEEVRVRLQLRTEVPLNLVRYRLRWRANDGLDLECESPPPVFFSRPDGTEYRPWEWMGPGAGPQSNTNFCGSIFGLGQAEATFMLAGADNTEHAGNRPDRPLEYFRPLGEWLDIVELRLQVPDEAVGGAEIPIGFETDFGSSRKDLASFIPYGGVYPCHTKLWPDDATYWKYNVIYHDSFIRVRGDPEPPPPPDLGIRFALGTATGAPGDLVEVPIQAASLFPLRRMRLALELDPAVLGVEAVELDFLDLRTDTIVQEQGLRGQNFSRFVCTDEDGDGRNDLCTGGVPAIVRFQDTDPSFILLDIYPGDPTYPYPGNVDGRLAEIGRFRLRIADDAPAGETILAPAVVPVIEPIFEVLVESGGNALDELNGPAGPYSPAREVVAGTVVVVDGPRSRDLVRGDANVDGGVDISDAVLMLNSLFTDRGEVLCEDAADADDNGALNITDPILLLGVLFGGGGALPPPSACAPDPTADTLGCAEGCDKE